jgi:hypothetical protein
MPTHPITISDVPYVSAGTAGNKANLLVTERFELAETLAEDQVNAAQVYLDSLKTLFATATMPSSDISYDFQTIALDSNIESLRPEAPSDADLTPGDVSVPVMGTLNNITVPTITIPTYTLVAPTDELVFNEPVYQSDLQNALKTALKDFVENGGTGLGSTVEDALWARARARQDILNERAYNEAEEYFASRGYTIPPGALGGRLTEASAEQIRGDAQLNYEISIEQARLARAQSEYSINAAINLEGQDKVKFTAMADRTLEAAKATVQVVLNLFDGKVREYIAKMDGTKTEVEAEKIKVDAAVAANSSIIDEYNANVEKYKTQLINEISIVEQVAKVYGYKIAGYETDAKVAAVDLDAQIKVYQGNIDQANNQTTLTLKEAELAVQSYLGALQLSSEAIKASGNISAQIAASALSAVNASASLGDSYSRSWDVDHGYRYSLSNSAGLSESHSYDETKVT